MADPVTAMECLHILARLYFGDLRPPVEPEPPAPPPTCERGVWTVYMTLDLCPRRWLSARWGSYQCQPTAVRCEVSRG